MTSDTSNLVTPADDGNAPAGIVVSGRATSAEAQVIDIAAAIDGQKRGPWLVRAAVKEAKRVVKAHSERIVKKSAA